MTFITLFVCGREGTSAYAAVVDKIVVIVNDEVITRGDIDRILRPLYQQNKDALGTEELAEKLDTARKALVKRLINDKLLLAEARKKEVEIDQAEIDVKIDEIKKRFPSEEEFVQAIAKENLVISDLEKQYRERMLIDKIIDQEVRYSISITPNEVLTYYEENKDKFNEPKKVKVSSILIRVGDQHSTEAAEKLARKILSRLEEGGDFAALAKKYSEGPYADSGGDMGWVKENELMDKINDLVFSLEINEISGILETTLGFHIFKVDAKAPARVKTFQEVKNPIEEILYRDKVEKKLVEWLDKLKENAYIAFR
ncbi:MAG: peptidylprolyl isomerase [Candidatus Omnitrophota bacterium]